MINYLKQKDLNGSLLPGYARFFSNSLFNGLKYR